ncbi:MAG: hypothetical protein JOY63_10535, partial [Acetobacteraceae bacterium]|nr:hypothetical protein [Acetobacteraceae bacterium]
ARAVAEKNRRNGARAYPDLLRDALPARASRWPLQEGMLAEPVTGAAALVLASEAYARERGMDAAWIAGMGWATEPSFLGDRNLAEAPALRVAARQAYDEAGVTNPADATDVAEVADATPFQELLAYEALGLAPRAEWGKCVAAGVFGPEGRVPVNLSGGALSLNPVYCTGLIRVAETANQVLGRSGRHQRAKARTGLAHAASGFAMQYNTVVVLSGGEQGATP